MLREVRNQTGYSRRAVRYADAVVVSVFPSRGLWIAGVECKESRGDWLNELGDASKASEIQQYCDRWWLASREGIVQEGEVPETWGWVEVAKGVAKVRKAAPKLTPRPLDATFVASVLRSWGKVGEAELRAAADAREREVRGEPVADPEPQVDWEGKYRLAQQSVDDLVGRIEAFEARSGETISSGWDAMKLGEAIKVAKALQSRGLDGERLARQLRAAAEALGG